MITPETLLAFATTALVVVLVPGPTVLLVTGYSLSSGFRMALLSIVGVCLGDAVAMTLTFIGLGAVLAASAELFLALKWIGAAYLIFLGIQLWRTPVSLVNTSVHRERRPLAIITRAFAVNVLHPKGLAFYAAFLPQFIDPGYPALPQMILLGSTFVTIALTVLTTYALTAARFRALLDRPRARRIMNRTGAGCLVGAGIYVLSLRRGN